ncbi:MAG TPA: efflux RND transporter periplasmic adaptor subunit [Caldithrix abyssi]|uniref:Efflux RND transporter periplasmic adaptor subunit n=1 Tax=Caldithrix abyssi TaxID=187145 RepID=A0A7V4UDW1_CALAY|nr:efflux RND transporter periplasmic adaptor subunit [Caldithrix abyssi]
MEKRILFLIPVLLIIWSCSTRDEPTQPPQVEVFVTKAADVPLYEDFVGTVAGRKDIAIRARVAGFLEGIHFNEGTMVKRGQLLYTIESQQYEAKAAAQLSKLAEAKINLAHAESELARIKPLAETNAISQSDLDAAEADYEAAKAVVKAAKANLRAANIELSYTKVKAPITGIIGKTKAKVGDFVGQTPNPVILNVVSQIDTVLVDFYLTEADYLRIFRNFLLNKDKQQEKEKDILQLILSDGTIHKEKGRVRFIDREIDVQTGAILIQASFPNPDGLLRPGLFGKVRVKFAVVKNGILIPQRCVSELQGTFSVYVVDEENKTEQRKVILGDKIGSFWLVKEGLKEGEKVIFEGLQKVKTGMVVNPIETKTDLNLQAVEN